MSFYQPLIPVNNPLILVDTNFRAFVQIEVPITDHLNSSTAQQSINPFINCKHGWRDRNF